MHKNVLFSGHNLMIIPTRNPLDIGKDCPKKFCRRIDTDAFCRRVSAKKPVMDVDEGRAFFKKPFFLVFKSVLNRHSSRVVRSVSNLGAIRSQVPGTASARATKPLNR